MASGIRSNRGNLGQVDGVSAWVKASTSGYWGGGGTDARVATADKITYSTGATAASTVSNLSQARVGPTGFSDKTTYGYWQGGETGTSVAVVTSDRITFSTDASAANTASNLSAARSDLAGLSDANLYGYTAGGRTGSSTERGTADRLTFSTGANAANTASDLSQARYRVVGLSDNSTYGYFNGGNTGDVVSTGDMITFSTGVTAVHTASKLPSVREATGAVSDNRVYGYYAGGSTGGVGNQDDTYRVTFSTQVCATVTASKLADNIRAWSGTGDGALYGYWSGGSTGAAGEDSLATIRITFSTGVVAANTASNLSQAREYLAALSNGSV